MKTSRWLAAMAVLWALSGAVSAADPADTAQTTPAREPAATNDSNAEQNVAAATTPAPGRRGSDRLDLDTTVVTGNRELPKVLYIVPWKKADLGDLPGQPFNTLLDETLTPVDRDVFRREVTYYGALSGAADGAAPPASGGSSTSGGSEK